MNKQCKILFTWSVIAVAAIGCSKPAKQTALMTEVGDLDISARELRVRTYAFADHFAGGVEMAADEIILQSDDPAVERNALIWKINVIPEMHKAAFQIDPFGALIDSYALCAQMTQYLSEGAGKDLFGEWQPIAIEASKQLETDVIAIGMLAARDDMTDGIEFIAGWVEKYPITSPTFTRESTIAHWAAYTAEEGKGGFAAIASFEESLSDLSERMRIYGAHIPRLAQWQAELLFAEISDRQDVTQFKDDVSSVEQSVQDVRDVFVDFPGIIEQERVALFKELDIRIARLTELLEKERMTIMDGATDERIAVLDALHKERVDVMSEISELMQATMTESRRPLTEVIDHFFLRLVQFSVAALLVLVVLRWVDLRMRKRSSS
ncbi:MAG: hypothetical protein JSW50_06700 [Candidatus Latescibacterota bacterium]|nr:MAG: hypothetical protein JSW50_06700 [Candidatus Latescibacterota bacterium]